MAKVLSPSPQFFGERTCLSDSFGFEWSDIPFGRPIAYDIDAPSAIVNANEPAMIIIPPQAAMSYGEHTEYLELLGSKYNYTHCFTAHMN